MCARYSYLKLKKKFSKKFFFWFCCSKTIFDQKFCCCWDKFDVRGPLYTCLVENSKFPFPFTIEPNQFESGEKVIIALYAYILESITVTFMTFIPDLGFLVTFTDFGPFSGCSCVVCLMDCLTEGRIGKCGLPVYLSLAKQDEDHYGSEVSEILVIGDYWRFATSTGQRLNKIWA